MPNVQNPKEFVITPGAPVTGAVVDDFIIQYAAAPGNTPPPGFPGSAPSVRVPAADMTVQPDGNVHVPFPDIVTNTLAAGTYVAVAEADSSAGVNSSGSEQTSGPSSAVFFDIVPPPPPPPPVPNPPAGFSVA